MAQTLGNVAVGAIVKLNENGSPVEYLVIQQGKPPDSMYDERPANKSQVEISGFRSSEKGNTKSSR